MEALHCEDARTSLRAAEAILALAFGRPGAMPEWSGEDERQSIDDMPIAERVAVLREALEEQERLAAEQEEGLAALAQQGDDEQENEP